MLTHNQIREILSQILKKLETTELKIERQSEEIKTYIEPHELDLDTSKLLMAQQRAIKTSIEILRDEIEELHQVVKLIFNEIALDQNKGEE
jgi:cell fate regulator YaaT (PSP1 superfamily)